MDEEKTRLLGQCLAVGFDGFHIPEEYRALVRRCKIGNVLLFRRNVESFAQLKALCAELNALILQETGCPPFILAGEEGGSVSRLGHIAGATPCPMAIGATGEKENAYLIGRWIGQSLRAVGINVDTAPVLDCFSNPDNTVIGTRSFGETPQKAADFGLAFMKGLQSAGVMACGKHFPGHGDTAVDSHLALPLIDKPEEALWQTELFPFVQAAENGIESFMTAHVLVPALDPSRLPATLSGPIMTGLLRQKMGYQGILFSDGMEMKAVMDLYGIEEATCRALAAGCDIALICHSASQAKSTMEYLDRAVSEGRLSLRDVRDRCRRIALWKQKLLPPQGTQADFSSPQRQRDCLRVMVQSLRLLHAPKGKPLPPLGKRTLFLGPPARPASIASDGAPLNGPHWLAQALGGVDGGLTGEGSAWDEIDSAVGLLSPHPGLPAVQQALGCLAQRGVPTAAVSLYTVKCLDNLPESVWKICAWQYDTLALQALLSGWNKLQ